MKSGIILNMKKLITAKSSFIVLVLIPTLLATIYNFILATPFYRSEAKVMVKILGSQESMSSLAGILRSVGILEPSSIGSYLVIDYIYSRDFMLLLEKKFSIKSHFGSDKVDIIQRFDPFGIDPSYENFYLNYYKSDKVVKVTINPNNSIITISYRSPDPKYAKSMADETIVSIESFINKINERASETKLDYFLQRLEENRRKIKELTDKIRSFMLNSKVVSPEQQAGVLLQSTAKLQEQLLVKQMELARIQSIAPENPRIPEIKREIEQIKKEIDKNLALVLGNQQAIGPSSVELELLKSEMHLLQKELEANLVSYIQAINQLRLQQIFVELIETPKVADAPVEPYRLKNIVTIFAIFFAIWGILSILYSGIREHTGR